MLRYCSKISPQTHSTEMSMNESEALLELSLRKHSDVHHHELHLWPLQLPIGTSTTKCTATGRISRISCIVWTMGKPQRHDGEVNVLEDELQQRHLLTESTVWTTAPLKQTITLCKNCTCEIAQPKSLGLPTIKGTQRESQHSARCAGTSKTSHTTVIDDERGMAP